MQDEVFIIVMLYASLNVWILDMVFTKYNVKE